MARPHPQQNGVAATGATEQNVLPTAPFLRERSSGQRNGRARAGSGGGMPGKQHSQRTQAGGAGLLLRKGSGRRLRGRLFTCFLRKWPLSHRGLQSLLPHTHLQTCPGNTGSVGKCGAIQPIFESQRCPCCTAFLGRFLLSLNPVCKTGTSVGVERWTRHP